MNKPHAPHRRRTAYLSLAAGTCMVFGLADAGNARQAPTEFEVSSIVVEQNATDGDTEVVIEALPGDEGLRVLRIRTPDRRTVVNSFSVDNTVMGIREFAFESPEPEGEAILAAYPEGVYRFFGISTSGERFAGRAVLSHALPAATVITSPPVDGEVPVGPLTIEWSAVPGIQKYVLELENESVDPERTLTVDLPPNRTRFRVPASLIAPNSDYQVGVATVASNGNVVVTEIAFSTGP